MLYLALGVLLSAAGAYLIVLIAGIVGRSDDPHATTRFTGSVGDAVFVFGALGLVLLLGILAVLMGIWQILHGRRNLALVRVVIVFYVFFWVGAVLVQLFG